MTVSLRRSDRNIPALDLPVAASSRGSAVEGHEAAASDDGVGAPRILFITTNRWPSDIGLLRALRATGAKVALLCPPHHPARAARLDGIHDNSVLRPVAALSRAIAAFSPDLLVPGDERARRVLHRLHATGGPRARTLVEASIGAPDAFEALLSRELSLEAARRAGMPVADAIADVSAEGLGARFASGHGPVVLKVDGTWAGEGVRIVRTAADVEPARENLLRIPFASGLKRWLVYRDSARLIDCLTGGRRTLSAQAYIPGGRVGDMALFCREGTVLAIVAAEREAGCGELGPSTIVRVVRRPELEEGARRFVRALGLSGFIGFDFMVDPATGDARVIEVNPRSTALAGVQTLEGISPALAAAVAFGATDARPPTPARDLVAYFPKAWTEHPGDFRLSLCSADLPDEDPALVEALLEAPWGEKSWRVDLWTALSTSIARARTRIRAPRST